MRNSFHPVTAIAGFTLMVGSLVGCSAISSVSEQLHNESTTGFASTADLVSHWDKQAPWLPKDATDIRIHESTVSAVAILQATSDSALAGESCIEVPRQSAPTFDADRAPDAYIDTVFACDDWAVMATGDGWFGWTPNHPDEKAASDAVTP